MAHESDLTGTPAVIVGSEVIEPRFHGFPGVGHGGYTAGVLAGYLPGSIEVRFSEPPPLATSLVVEEGTGEVSLRNGDCLVATARRIELDLVPPPAPTQAEAEAAMIGYMSVRPHPSPECMTCGPMREPGQGLRVALGPVAGYPLAAGAWTPHPNFVDGQGNLDRPFVWAALDCPSYWGVRFESGDPGKVVTVRLAARLLASVPVGEPAIVVGWPIQDRGRLLVAGSAILTPAGEPLAIARATWMRATG